MPRAVAGRAAIRGRLMAIRAELHWLDRIRLLKIVVGERHVMERLLPLRRLGRVTARAVIVARRRSARRRRLCARGKQQSESHGAHVFIMLHPMRRGIAFAMVLAACGPKAQEPVVIPPGPPPVQPQPSAPAACAWGFARPELPIVIDQANLGPMFAGYAGGKILIAYSARQGPGYGRFIDPQTNAVGTPFTIASDPLPFMSAVIGLGDKFVVTWTFRDALFGRFVHPDGTLDPAVKLSNGGSTLVPVGDHFLLVTSSGGLSGCALEYKELRPNLAPAQIASTTTDKRGCTLGSLRQIGTEVWHGYEMASDGAYRSMLARLDVHGQPLARPIDLGDASTFDFIAAPDGAALALFGHGASKAPTLARMDRHGQVQMPSPLVVPAFADIHRRPVLGMLDGQPMVRANVGTIVPLGWDGAEHMSRTTVAPFANTATLVEADRESWLVWTDARHAHDEIYAAPLGCNGAVPTPTDPLVFVDFHASAPPLAVQSTCPKLGFEKATAIAPAREDARFIRHNDELLVGWTEPHSVMTRRVNIKTGATLGPPKRAAEDAVLESLSIQGKDAIAIMSDFELVNGVQLDAEGVAAAWAPISGLIGHEPREVSSLGNGQVLWLGGEPSILESRRPAGPIVDLTLPDSQTKFYRAAPLGNGFVAAWTRTDKTMIVARVESDKPTWAARVNVDEKSSLHAIGVIGDQIMIALDEGDSRLVRFTLDGARLDDVKLDWPFPIKEVAITNRGIVSVIQDKALRECVELTSFDGKLLTPASCAPRPADDDIDPGAEHHIDERLLWTDNTLHWLRSGKAITIDRWRCN